jgi:FdhE protein
MAAPPDRLLLLERRVTALRKARPDLDEALDLQQLLIRTALETARPPNAEPFALPREAAAARLREGIPLLHDQPITLDINFAADLFSRLVNALSDRDEPGTAAGLEAIAGAATNGHLDPQQLFAEAFVQHFDHLADLAASAGVDAALLAALGTQAVAPLLRAYAERLLPMLERVDDGTQSGAVWQAGYCPICGGWPLLGELRGVELSQWLRCSACGTGWRGQRLACSYCANDDYRTLGTLAVEGEQRFRISVCERCKGYLKVGNAFDPPPAELLPIDDVASMHLDLAAVERGYQRPPGSGYRIELAVPDAEWIEELA